MTLEEEKEIKQYKKQIQALQRELRQKEIIIESLTTVIEKKRFSKSEESSSSEHKEKIRKTSISEEVSKLNINETPTIKEDTLPQKPQALEPSITDFSKGFSNFGVSASPINTLPKKQNKRAKFAAVAPIKPQENNNLIKEVQETKTTFHQPNTLEKTPSQIKTENKAVLTFPIKGTRKKYSITGTTPPFQRIILNENSCFEDFLAVLNKKNILNELLRKFCNHNRPSFGAKQTQLDTRKVLNDMLNIETHADIKTYLDSNREGLYRHLIRNLNNFSLTETVAFYLIFVKGLNSFERTVILTDFLFYSASTDFFMFVMLIVIYPFDEVKSQENEMFKCILKNEIKEIDESNCFSIDVPGRNFSLKSLINFIREIYRLENYDLSSHFQTNVFSKIQMRSKKIEASDILYLEEFKTSFLINSVYIGAEQSLNTILQPLILSKNNEKDPLAYYLIGNFLLVFLKNSKFKETEMFKNLLSYIEKGMGISCVNNICCKMLNCMGIYY
ncbi:hypothetical protein CDIK_1288 [Cucumispora dikerogammari]|nr:hypothetical protein CDIK_1288 [Cucumispora dikerogammari]